MQSSIGQYTLNRNIGSGGFGQVWLASDQHSNQYAIKIMDCSNGVSQYLAQHEAQIMEMLNHPNILNVIEYQKHATWKNENGEQVRVAYIVLEYCSKGELFNYISAKTLNESVCRYYFKQLLLGLHNIHDNVLAHRDLKPENLLLTENYTLKIADYGFTTALQGKYGEGILYTKCGSENYMAPEVLYGLPYEGKLADIFSAGVILFAMHSGHLPFYQASKQDERYRLIAANRADIFWAAMSQNKHDGFYSEEFKDLVTCMLQYNPQDRLSLGDVLGHPWMQGYIASESEVQDELSAN